MLTAACSWALVGVAVQALGSAMRVPVIICMLVSGMVMPPAGVSLASLIDESATPDMFMPGIAPDAELPLVPRAPVPCADVPRAGGVPVARATPSTAAATAPADAGTVTRSCRGTGRSAPAPPSHPPPPPPPAPGGHRGPHGDPNPILEGVPGRMRGKLRHHHAGVEGRAGPQHRPGRPDDDRDRPHHLEPGRHQHEHPERPMCPEVLAGYRE